MSGSSRPEKQTIIGLNYQIAACEYFDLNSAEYIALRRQIIAAPTNLTRGQSNLTKGRIVAPKIHARCALTKPKVVFLK